MFRGLVLSAAARVQVVAWGPSLCVTPQEHIFIESAQSDSAKCLLMGEMLGEEHGLDLLNHES